MELAGELGASRSNWPTWPARDHAAPAPRQLVLGSTGRRTRTEVTEADREAGDGDQRSAGQPLGPGHGPVRGGARRDGRARLAVAWIVDPIDGTTNYVRGVPVWATLIGLVAAGPVVGVVSAPALGRRWWAARGRGAFVDGLTDAASLESAVDDAQVRVTFSSGWDAAGDRGSSRSSAGAASRGFGDFWQHMLVAEGAVDVAVDADLSQPYDLAAVKIIVEEAGGTFTDRFGEPTPTSPSSAISSNGLLHDEVIARLAG